ncbi:uncharacterized protein G2W53_003113 [Senna tora]|uniref:Uncharacterized protein n=1 Tax=Senna tora TaxID=362788 RepID=A0A834X9Z0_9FABA|nr:uncharacterized protein G2W53_003113 [Senna tora]
MKATVVGHRMQLEQNANKDRKANQKQGRRWGEPQTARKTDALVKLMEKLRVEELAKEQGVEGEKVGDGKDTSHILVACVDGYGGTFNGEDRDKVVQNGEVGRAVVEEEIGVSAVSEVASQKQSVLQEIQNVLSMGEGGAGGKENVDPLPNMKSLRRYKKEARSHSSDPKGSTEVNVLCKRKWDEGREVEEANRMDNGLKKRRGEVVERMDGMGGGSRQLIEKDLIRCIWDGRSTAVWGDAWIPGLFPFSIAKPDNIIAGGLRVCDLLDDTGMWRDDVLAFLFTDNIFRHIKSIGARDVRLEDRWNWLGDAKGGFTVKPCYLKAMKLKWQVIDLLPSVQGGVHSDFWRRLWKLSVPPKYKMLVWRACVGVLPTCVALSHKGVEMGVACTFCGNEDEETYHVLVECPRLHGIWSGSRFGYESRRWHNNITEWLAVEGASWTQEQWGMCVIALYLLWETRNAVRFSNARLSTDQFWCRVAAVWEEMQDLTSWKEWNSMFGQRLRREKPTRGLVKINTDAGTLVDGGGVIGGLLRGGDGICVAAFTARVEMDHHATVLEAEAIRRGMEMALGLGFKRVVCETDAKQVVEYLLKMDANCVSCKPPVNKL